MLVSGGWGATDLTGGPEEDRWENLLLRWGGGSAYFKGVDKGFPWLAQTQAILPVLVVRIQLDLGFLPDDPVRVSGFGGQDLGVLELNVMSPAVAVLGYLQPICLDEPDESAGGAPWSQYQWNGHRDQQIQQAHSPLKRVATTSENPTSVTLLPFVNMTFNCIRFMLSRHNKKSVGLPPRKFIVAFSLWRTPGTENSRCVQHTLRIWSSLHWAVWSFHWY
jgi:hypothetical protein